MKKLSLSLVVIVFCLMGRASDVVAAQWANPDLLVTPDQVEKNIKQPDWVVVDCRDLKDYAKGHIPGAISFGNSCKKALRDGTSRAYPDVSKYDKIFGKVGIGNNTNVVFYGDMKTESMDSATVGFWILEYLGHNKARVLNGGLEAWVKAGKKLDKAPTIKPPASFAGRFVKSRYASTDEVLKIAKGEGKGVQLVDARTKEEHEGRDIRSLRGGHVPHTTINVPYLDTFDKSKDLETGKDKPNGVLSPDHVAKTFASLDKNKRTIIHCQTGTRSTVEYLEMRLLGFREPANWDDSWIVWGNDFRKNYPIEDEQWIDFSRIKNLEKEVNKLKEPKKGQE